MLLLFPAPGYVAQIMQKYQQQRMKRTDARVQNVTESELFRLTFSDSEHF